MNGDLIVNKRVPLNVSLMIMKIGDSQSRSRGTLECVGGFAKNCKVKFYNIRVIGCLRTSEKYQKAPRFQND